MPRPQRSASRRSDASDVDADQQLAENELSKLQRQYRIMEGDRQAYNIESQDLIRRQLTEINKLEKEKKEMMKDYNLSDNFSNTNMDNENVDSLTNLTQTLDENTKLIDEEKSLNSELDKKIKSQERKVSDQQQKMGGIHASSQFSKQLQKNIHVLENRLDQANRKFNSLLTTNENLRLEIDSLRVERARFEGIRKRLEKERYDLRNKIGEVIDSSTQAYDSRDEAQAKMILLKEKADKDMAQHSAEMKELQRVIDHDRKLREFMMVKSKEREEDEHLRALRQKRESEEAEKKRKQRQEDSIEAYEEAFEKIKEITEEEDLDKLVSKFIEVEDRNFALFNYVNEQNNEVELLQEQINETREEVRKFESQGTEMEEQRKDILKDLESKQVMSSKEADEYNTKAKSVSKILDQLKAGVESLFTKINCDPSAVTDMLGGHAGVQDENMMSYLGIVEQRTNELLAIVAYLNAKDYDRPYDAKAVGLLGEGPQPPAQQTTILPPSTGDEYESDLESQMSDEDSKPLTNTEIKQRIMKRVFKREEQQSKMRFQYDLSGAKELKKQGVPDKKRGGGKR